MKHPREKDLDMSRTPLGMPLSVGLVLVMIALPALAPAHEGHPSFSAGEPGNPKRPARTIKVIMKEMLFDPSLIEVRKGEQVRFVLENDGTEDHEFMLATAAENREHGERMKGHPDMEHDDPNGKRIAPHARRELLWKFTKVGEFEYACLIPTHYDFGMFGKIVVK
jgi:uncharacterized cupredoxin-like copper-binding protein